MVGSPLDIGDDEEVKRVSLDLRVKDVDFAARLASYRNQLAAAQGKKIKRLWTTKSVLESFAAQASDGWRAQIAEMIKENGPLPEADDEAAMARYVRKLIAGDKRQK